ncbi:MAG: S-methyl-5-thioribose-1-phosphate isomerase [Caeruleum heppii]|nr:MAG: S-methyl-5-thioribose-1-phosphate isomerase [Caeruleum heppii]
MPLTPLHYTPSTPSSSSSSSSPPKPSTLTILNQLALPHTTSHVPINTAADAHHVIKTMKVRGAPLIALVAVLGLAVEASTRAAENTLPADARQTREWIVERLEYLVTSRPTAVNLSEAVGRLRGVVGAVEGGGLAQEVARAYVHEAEEMLRRDLEDNEAMGRCGAEWILGRTTEGRQGEKVSVLTHCNTGFVYSVLELLDLISDMESIDTDVPRLPSSLATSGYGTALGVIRSLHSASRLHHAYCTETRPYNQGSRLTAYELVHDAIPATLITDSMAGALLALKAKPEKIVAIVVGADRVAANGDTANKIGTYGLAVLAKHHNLKFLVAAPRTTIDLATPSGKSIVIEDRAPEEMTCVTGPRMVDGEVQTDEDVVTVALAAPGIGVWNPAFDVTPAELIDGIITERGVVEKGADGAFHFDDISDEARP